MVYENPAVVIGGQTNGLGVIRNLGRMGIDAYCLVDNARNFAVYSNYCTGYAVVPGVEADFSVLTQCLQTLEKRFGGPVYLHPTGDLSVLNLATMFDRQLISKKYVAALPPREVVETLVVKKKFYQSLSTHDIPHPTTIYIDDEDFESKARFIRFPVFVKPSISQSFARFFPGKKGFVARNKRELQKYLRLMARHDLDVVIQQIILGGTTNHIGINGYFNNESKPVLLVAHQKIRQPTFFSIHSVLLSIPLGSVAKLVELIVRYLSSLHYQGLFTAEFKKDARDNQYRLLEVNARSTWPNTFLTTIGVNQVLTAYRESMGEVISPMKEYQTGMYSINLIRDIQSIKNLLLERNLSIDEVFQPYLRQKHWLIYAQDDPMPFVKSLQIGVLNRLTPMRIIKAG